MSRSRRSLPFIFGILLLFQFFSSSSKAAITITGVVGVSNSETIANSLIAYGGTAGDSSGCPAGADTDTCNTCVQTAGPEGQACNTNGILSTRYVSITYTSSTKFGTPRLIKTNSSTATTTALVYTATPSSTTAINQTVTLRVRWSDICGAIDSTKTNCSVDGSVTASLGFSDTPSDATLSDSTQISFNVQRSMCDLTTDTTASTNCNIATAAGTDDGAAGISKFEILDGDAKVYLDNTETSNTSFPNRKYSGYVLFKKIRLFYTTVPATDGSICGTYHPQILNSSAYFDIELDGSAPGQAKEFTKKITGLQNDQGYLFKLALVDKANNVGFFFPQVQCADYANNLKYADYGNHVGRPSQVQGLLQNQYNCAIATATYGSPLEGSVQTLRQFRDQILLPLSWGQRFVSWYYKVSPEIAEHIRQSPILKTLSLAILTPTVAAAHLILTLGLNGSLVFLAIIFFAAGVFIISKKPRWFFFNLILIFSFHTWAFEPSTFEDNLDDGPSELAKEKGVGKITKKGEFEFKKKETVSKNSFGFRVGQYNPSRFKNPASSLNYSEIYGGPTALFLFDYEWRLIRSAGSLGLKAGAGLAMGQGNGRFSNASVRRVGGSKGPETYTLGIVPLSASLQYRLQVWEKQILVPTGEVGLDYVGISEFRDDGTAPKWAGVPGWHAALGGQFLMDFLAPDSMRTLESDYGVQHVYLAGEYRILQGFYSTLDISDQILSFGINLSF